MEGKHQYPLKLKKCKCKIGGMAVRNKSFFPFLVTSLKLIRAKEMRNFQISTLSCV